MQLDRHHVHPRVAGATFCARRLLPLWMGAIFSFLAFWSASSASAASAYKIVALDPLPGGVDSYATGINELGVVVGHSTLDRSGHVGQSRPVMWDSAGTPTELWSDPEFGGIPADVNNLGQVVGRYGSGSGIPLPGPGIPPGGAFIWDPVTREFMDLGDMGGQNVQATGINELGQVTGSSENFEGEPRAFIWDAVNDMRPIGTLGGTWSFGTDINNSGQIAGYSWRADQSEHAFLWDPVTGMQDLGNPDRLRSRAYALNDHSEVVGDGQVSENLGGVFVWRGDSVSKSVLPFSRAFDINRHGEIVGYTSGNGRTFAVLWDELNGVQNLETFAISNSEWRLEVATATNDRGQIIGYGWQGEQLRGFLLTPVPEPSSLACALIGAVSAIVVYFSNRRARD